MPSFQDTAFLQGLDYETAAQTLFHLDYRSISINPGKVAKAIFPSKKGLLYKRIYSSSVALTDLELQEFFESPITDVPPIVIDSLLRNHMRLTLVVMILNYLSEKKRKGRY